MQENINVIFMYICIDDVITEVLMRLAHVLSYYLHNDHDDIDNVRRRFHVCQVSPSLVLKFMFHVWQSYRAYLRDRFI